MNKYLILITIMLFFACKQPTDKTEAPVIQEVEQELMDSKIPGDFAHTVYFWLNEPKNTEARMAFESSLTKFLNTSTNIETKHIGVPAKTDRDVIDNSYTYSLLLTFKDKAAQDRYQDEPAHKQFIEESSKLWNKVLVYDSENILKD